MKRLARITKSVRDEKKKQWGALLGRFVEQRDESRATNETENEQSLQ